MVVVEEIKENEDLLLDGKFKCDNCGCQTRRTLYTDEFKVAVYCSDCGKTVYKREDK